MTYKKISFDNLENYINKKISIVFDNFTTSGLLTDFQKETEKYKLTLKQPNGAVGIYFVPNCIKIQSINKK